MQVKRVPIDELGVYLAADWQLIEFIRVGAQPWAVVAKREMRVREVHS